MAVAVEGCGNNTERWGQLMFSVFLYWVWRIRNIKKFEGKETTWESAVYAVVSDVRMKLNSIGYCMEEGLEKAMMEERWGFIVQVKNKVSTWERWYIPPTKLNIDGSLKNNNGT